MKREIVCSQKCFPPFRFTLAPDGTFVSDPYPGEHSKIVPGLATKTGMICDVCGKEIRQDDNCFAVSMWADYGGIPYYPWEHEYITD